MIYHPGPSGHPSCSRRGVATKKPEISEPFRKVLRNAGTPAEALLWSQLKQRQTGKKFRRQYSVGPYILELDGANHFLLSGAEKDAERDAYLKDLGITVLRFENELVHRELDWVVGAIRERIQKTPLIFENIPLC